MEILSETSPAVDLKHGHIVVGVEAVPLSHSFTIRRGVLVRAANENTANIYIGLGPHVRTSGAEGGLPLTPGTSLHIPVDDPSALYVISTDTDQDLAWMAV